MPSKWTPPGLAATRLLPETPCPRPGPAFSSDVRAPAGAGGHTEDLPSSGTLHVCDPISAAGEDVCGDDAGKPASSCTKEGFGRSVSLFSVGQVLSALTGVAGLPELTLGTCVSNVSRWLKHLCWTSGEAAAQPVFPPMCACVRTQSSRGR